MSKPLKLISAVSVVVAAVAIAWPHASSFVAGSDKTRTTPVLSAIKRSMPNGKTDVIKVMGVKWSDIELKG